MRTTIVPAQITSVEDKISGNLSFKQLLLMIVPVFISAALFAFIPPFVSFHIYKVVITIIIATFCISLALRIKGRLLIDWFIILSRYNLRPRYYVFNKNNLSSRIVIKSKKENVRPKLEEKSVALEIVPQFAYNTNDEMRFEDKLINPAANLHFTLSKKGGLRVHIKEVK